MKGDMAGSGTEIRQETSRRLLVVWRGTGVAQPAVSGHDKRAL